MEASERDTIPSGGDLFRGRYEILGELGAGAYSRVFKARQRSTGQLVAVKVLRARLGDETPEAVLQKERFRREMHLCAELSHPHIVRLLDSGETTDGALYGVFELVPGVTLREVLAAEGCLSVAETLRLMTQLLEALSCAHAHGVVHRDLKPENVIITKTGARRNALILDFGLGGLTAAARNLNLPRLTGTDEIMGTPCYAAPEQLRGEAPSVRSDLYSWGLIALECLTGETAITGASASEVVLKQLGPDPLLIPGWLRSHRLGRVLQKVVTKDVERRDVTAESLLDSLERISQRNLPSPAVTPAPTPLTEGERRQITAVSCRLGIVTGDDQRIDVEDFDQAFHSQHAVIAEHAARRGGQLVSTLADRAMLVFGLPQAREEDTRHAARAALDIMRSIGGATVALGNGRPARVRVHIGVHTGVIVVREQRTTAGHATLDLVGLTPRIAASLDEHAEDGDILVSADTQRLLRDEIAAEPAGSLQLADLSAQIPIYRLSTSGNSPSSDTVAARETPFVGRAEELAQLQQRWVSCQAGRGSVALVRGEAGIGKSRLLHELQRTVPPEAWLQCRCTVESQDTPLQPVTDALLAVEEPVETLLQRYGMQDDPTLPALRALVSAAPADRESMLTLSPERQREMTLSALITLVLKMSAARARVLVVEDLHWADPTTLELLGLLAQEIRTQQMIHDAGAALCVLLTARQEFVPPWSTDDMLLVQLPRLSRHEVEQMVSLFSASGISLPPAVREQVIRRADGIPLFVEEVTRMLLESGPATVPDGVGVDGPGALIPTSLRMLLATRLDAASPGAREVAQMAAALGREFHYEVLRSVTSLDEHTLRADLRELTQAGLVLHRPSPRGDSYVFKHALMRDTAYDSMVRPRRQSIHRRIANAFEERFPEIAQRRPEVLALHFENAGLPAAAASYWYRAGEQALQRASYAEAVSLLERGLTQMAALPESPERDRQEVELLTALGTGFFNTKGYSAPEVKDVFERAQQVCERLGDDVPDKVLYGIWGVNFGRSDRAAAERLVPVFERLAERPRSVESLVIAHCILGANGFVVGNFSGGLAHSREARRLYDNAVFRRFTRDWGYDPGVYAYVYELCSLFSLGYPEQAESVRREVVALTERSGDPLSQCVALGFGVTLPQLLGDADTVLETAQRLAEVAAEQRLPLWMAIASVARGGGLTLRGELDAAIADLQQALSVFQFVGLQSSYSYYLLYLAAAYLAAGRAAEGLAVVDESLSYCDAHLWRFHESDALRLKGDLLLLQDDATGAETCLQRALSVAQRQQARSYEMRAATSLARLWRQQGKGAAARALLQPIYAWFTEGFETQDLRYATALLAKLG